jgi:1-phosphofructokinase
VIHLATLNPSLDLHFVLDPSSAGKVGRVLAQEVLPGGKALNLARFLARMRVPCRCWIAGAGGRHPTQRLYREILRRHDPALRTVLPGGTVPLRFNLHVRKGRRFEKHNHAGFALPPAGMRSLRRDLLRSTRPGDPVVLTGRLPAGLPATTYRDWILELQSAGRAVFLDTSGPALLAAFSARPFFLKVNLDEMGGALGRRFRGLDGFLRAQPALLRRGLVRGVVTDGPRGYVVWEGLRILRGRTPRPVRRPDVVGAGDGFLAGWLAALHAGLPLPQRALFASECGRRVAESGIDDFRPPERPRRVPTS